MKYSDRITQEQRLLVLQALYSDTDFRTSDDMLSAYLDEFGLSISLDKLSTELTWLEEQGLVALESAKSMVIATLKRRGMDVAQGRTLTAGVARPRPE